MSTPSYPGRDARPTLAVYTIAERQGNRSVWTRIGSAWTNKDGSITVRLDALPVSGVLQVRDGDPPQKAGG